jgi:hypothetical protein
MGEDDRAQLHRQTLELSSILNAMGLSVSQAGADRLAARLAQSAMLDDLLYDLIRQLTMRVRDELRSVMAWQIPPHKLRFFEKHLFGEKVEQKFGSLRADVEEAGKCLAMNRNTASVFHLMRVMEGGLRALAVSLRDSSLVPKRNPSWDTILKRSEKELQKPLKDRRPAWRKDELFASTAVANLRAVKDAWRNPTMHVERNYNEEEALEVWNAARAFMRHLATKLSE